MKKILIATLVAVLALTGSVSLIAAAASVTTPGPVNLIADGGADGEKLDVGDLTLSYDGTDLTVAFVTNGSGWQMTETHLNVSSSAPTKSAPGKFTYKHEGLGGIPTDSYTFAQGTGLCYIAAQAEVQLNLGDINDDGVDEYQVETAWAEGTVIRPGKNWATYFPVELASPSP